jgi:hypothetical protein
MLARGHLNQKDIYTLLAGNTVVDVNSTLAAKDVTGFFFGGLAG